jgi:hypothetical protein
MDLPALDRHLLLKMDAVYPDAASDKFPSGIKSASDMLQVIILFDGAVIHGLIEMFIG